MNGHKHQVFISHKSEDRSIAETLKNALDVLSKFQLMVHISADMPAGTDYRQWIDKRLDDSQVLIFLYTSAEMEMDWLWCIYEIGIFHGQKTTKDTDATNKDNILCIKHPDIPDPPKPIEHIQVCNANPLEIEKLFVDLIYSGEVFSPEPLISGQVSRRLDEEVGKVVKAFKPPVNTKFFENRLVITLSREEDERIIPNELEESSLSGNKETMKLLGDLTEGAKWRHLFEVFKNRNQHEWLNQLKDSIELIKRKREPIDVLQPFTALSGETYLPIVTRTETYPVKEDGEKRIIPKQLSVIFTSLPQPPRYTLRDMRDITDNWKNFPPTSVVKIKWKGVTGMERKESDTIGDPYVCSANHKFARLWDFKHSDYFPIEDHPNKRVTDKFLYDSVEKYIDGDDFKKFKADQKELAERAIYRGKDGMAEVPLQFNDKHKSEEYKNQTYLPYLISRHIVGNESEEHVMYLLVCYIKYFLPLKD